MCGRITAAFEFSDIRVRSNRGGDLNLYAPRRNISVSGQKVSVFVRRKNRQRGTVMHWDLILHWVENPSTPDTNDKRSLVQKCGDLLSFSEHLHGCERRWNRWLSRTHRPFGLLARTWDYGDLVDAFPVVPLSRRRIRYFRLLRCEFAPRNAWRIRRVHARSQQRGIHVIIDLVVNHTSDQHPWF
jgi:Alpha amylase, catalytic domain